MKPPIYSPAKILDLLGQAWMRNPASRLVQLVDNAAHYGGWRQQDVFYCNDDTVAGGLHNMLLPKPILDPLITKYSYLVMRRPSVQEDEGCYHLESQHDSLVEAGGMYARLYRLQFASRSAARQDEPEKKAPVPAE